MPPILGLAAPLADAAESVTGLDPTWEQVLGRMHPALVHLPLGLFVAAGLFALVGGARGRLNGTVRACLVLGLLVGLAAGGSGWLLAHHDHGNEEALETHRWSAVAAVSLALVVLLVGLGAAAGTSRARAFRWLTVLLAGVTAFAGHEGGELVWGPGWATKPLRAGAEAPPAGSRGDAAPAATSARDTAADELGDLGELGPAGDVEDELAALEEQGLPGPGDATAEGAAQTVDFHAQIAPIFAESCIECHGPERARGRLRLDAEEFAFAGDYPAIERGNPAASELFRRVTLPDGHEELMPEKGERLAPGEIELLRRWIEQGAPWPEQG